MPFGIMAADEIHPQSQILLFSITTKTVFSNQPQLKILFIKYYFSNHNLNSYRNTAIPKTLFFLLNKMVSLKFCYVGDKEQSNNMVRSSSSISIPID